MELLRNFLKKELDVELSPEAEEKFRVYLCELKEWNKKINLTSIKTDKDIEKYHFIDSLYGLKAGLFDGAAMLDIGAGAGFPGIPIKIIKPSVKMFLAESVRKKCEFMSEVVGKLSLGNTEILNRRSEDLPGEMRESFDFVFCRALAQFSVAAELTLPWLNLGGKAVFYLKKSFEIKQYAEIIALLGGEIIEEKEYVLPGENEGRKISVIKKIKPIPERFPRRAGMAKKKPLK